MGDALSVPFMSLGFERILTFPSFTRKTFEAFFFSSLDPCLDDAPFNLKAEPSRAIRGLEGKCSTANDLEISLEASEGKSSKANDLEICSETSDKIVFLLSKCQF